MTTPSAKTKPPSTDQSTDINFKIDLSLFQTQKYDEKCTNINCESIQRLIHALSYYSKLDIMKIDKHRDLFEHFMNDTYHQFLNDFIHLVNIHSIQIYEINQNILKKQLLKEVDIKRCDFTTRHHRGNDDEKEEIKPFSPTSDFYKRSMDSLGFYLLHLFDCGLRVHHQNNDDEQEEIKYNDDDDNVSVDKQFARTLKAINERKHLTMSFSRFKTNTKYIIDAGIDIS